MLIDFSSIPAVAAPCFKGGRKEYLSSSYSDGNNKIMRGVLIPGASIGMHTHTDTSETIFIQSGVGTLIENGETKEIHPGECAYCPVGGSHSLENNGSTYLVFFAVVAKQ